MATQKKRKTGHKQSLARARVLPPEVNHSDIAITGATLVTGPVQPQITELATPANVLDHITHINRGDADNQRVASKLKALTLEAELFFAVVSGTTWSGGESFPVTGASPTPLGFIDRLIDVWIVQNKNPRGVAPTAANIWEQGGANLEQVLMRKHDQASEYRVLKHLRVHVPCSLIQRHVYDTSTSQIRAILPAWSHREKFFLQLPDDLVTTYKDAQSGAIANTIEHNLHLFTTMDNAGTGTTDTPIPTIALSGNMRLRFLDM